MRALEDAVPAGTFLGVRASIQDRQSQRRVNIFAVNDEICRLIIRAFHRVNCRRRGYGHCRPWVLGKHLGAPRIVTDRGALSEVGGIDGVMSEALHLIASPEGGRTV